MQASYRSSTARAYPRGARNDAEHTTMQAPANGPGAQLLQPSPQVAPPVLIGALAGPGAAVASGTNHPYGTNLGSSYEHDGRLFLLFGDTWLQSSFDCSSPLPTNDDTIATLPPVYPGAIPPLQFLTKDGAPNELRTLQLMRASQSLPLGPGRVAMTAFSDGAHVFAAFARLDPTRCDPSGGDASCPADQGFTCSAMRGLCEPGIFGVPVACDPAGVSSCLPTQTCVLSASAFCMDPTSSQYEHGFDGESSAIAQNTELAVQREGSPEIYDAVFTLPTSKFANVTARTVARFTGQSQGNDYGPGRGAVLIWGRPGFAGEHGREAQLYLMAHQLPLQLQADGTLDFQPSYYAGVDEKSGEPIWSALQSRAKPLALDGRVGGDPHEEQPIVNQGAVSWLPAPIAKWVMLYGGDASDYLLVDPISARARTAQGSISIRFADQPWGPWSPPQAHLSPGTPDKLGDPYGPGGFLYHFACVDQSSALCARSDPSRPPDLLQPNCRSSAPQADIGRLYGVNIIDSYTSKNADGGLDLFWNVSTWNPFAVVLMKTSVLPAPAPAPELERELADAPALERMSSLQALPTLRSDGKYVEQSSHDLGDDDLSSPLSRYGNRDFNNFLCASGDASFSARQYTPYRFEEPECAESYVRGAVLARFEGAGKLVRTWLALSPLLTAPPSAEVLRVYVDDDPQPRVEIGLAEALASDHDELFAPPFGAGSMRRFAWYYPVVFSKKLVVTLNGLSDYEDVYYQCDAVMQRDPSLTPSAAAAQPADRGLARAQLMLAYPASSAMQTLGDVESIALGPGEERTLRFSGPATIEELRVRAPDAAFDQLRSIELGARWNDSTEDAIAVPLLALFASDAAPPELASPALASYLESNRDRVLALRLPMPFEQTAEWRLRNAGTAPVAFTFQARGRNELPAAPFGHLHVEQHETLGPTSAAYHVAAATTGRGRLVGVCARLEGEADPAASFLSEPLNFLEGDVLATIDGEPALEGTGTEDYADNVFYFQDSPQASAFAQAWSVDDGARTAVGVANFCRWHVLGTELDFQSSIELKFELGGMHNPQIVHRIRTLAYSYLAE
jgi:hypothetical protein